MHCLYVLESIKSKRKYIGIAADIEKRLIAHNTGNVRSTKAYIPWKIICVESFSTKADVAAREHDLKRNSWKRYDLYEKIKYGPIV